MTAGVAAGHPATAEVGLRTIAAGGSAADAAVAAMLASCVAETVLTGIGGAGFATYYDAASGTVTCLDFFAAVPGVDSDRDAAPMTPIEVSLGNVPMDYLIGGASVAVPGVPAGAGEMHRRWGRLPWPEVVRPAITLARAGTILPAAHARTLVSVAAALLPGDGAATYAPGGRLLSGGERLHHPGLDTTLTALAEEGPAVFYTGWIGAHVVNTVRAHGGVLTRADHEAYRVRQVPVESATLAGHHVFARLDLNNTVRTIAALDSASAGLAGLAGLAGMARPERAVAVADALCEHARQKLGDTTNISVVDHEGNACVVTTTLGIGSGVWPSGLGFNLNSMLGEGELVTPDLIPGRRMSSMMCPLVVIDPAGGLALAAGASGASRIRTALIETLLGVLVDRVDTAAAIAAPRFHALAANNGGPAVVHAEPGRPADELAALACAGYAVRQWDYVSDYFGGASAVGPSGAAGDPRRGGVGVSADRVPELPGQLSKPRSKRGFATMTTEVMTS